MRDPSFQGAGFLEGSGKRFMAGGGLVGFMGEGEGEGIRGFVRRSLPC
jgi:hypothetical protein